MPSPPDGIIVVRDPQGGGFSIWGARLTIFGTWERTRSRRPIKVYRRRLNPADLADLRHRVDQLIRHVEQQQP